MIEVWENDEVARCFNTRRPLTHSLDLGEEGLAVQATRICSLTDCDRPHWAHGLCRNHGARLKTHGDPLGGRRTPRAGALCGIEGCDRPHLSRGWCSLHYGRWMRAGDPLTILPSPANQSGQQNLKWLGQDISYGGVHARLRRANGSAAGRKCADCGSVADEWSYDHLDPDEMIEMDGAKQMRYSAKIGHYQARCKSCHWKIDHPDGKRTRA